MGRSCCVPGCKSNYGNSSHISVFKFPKDETLRLEWIKKIHRADFVVNDKTVVCINHFEPRFIVKEDVFPVLNGEPIRVPRKIPKLTDDAYPTIFPNQPAYLTVKLNKQRKTPEERVKQVLQRDEENFNEWCQQDTITTFDSFVSEIKKKKKTGTSIFNSYQERLCAFC